MKNLYEKSWELYKFHSDYFQDDNEYYLNFCRGKKTLELFAGYGRLSNFLARNEISLHTIELSEEFSDLIELPDSRKHIGDVTTTILNETFERIIAGYNSFCLLTENDQLTAFFRNIKQMLANDGQISLSYYHPDFWTKAERFTFSFRDHKVEYVPEFDLSKRKEKKGIWRDRYVIEGVTETHQYPVRIFENKHDLEPFLKQADLRITNIIENYNNPNISEPEWAA